MVLPVLAAVAKLASRGRKVGDFAYNARRRFIRRAERLYKQADKTIGEAANRYRTMAEYNLRDAAKLYENARDRTRFESKMKTKYGVDLSDVKNATPAQRAQLYNESFETLKDATEARTAKEIMSSAAGKRIMASTANIWKSAVKVNADGERVIDTQAAYGLIMRHFQADSMMDVIGQFERRFGDDLYSQPDSIEKYKEITAEATEFVRDLTDAPASQAL